MAVAMNRSFWWRVIAGICITVGLFFIYNLFFVVDSTWNSQSQQENPTTCTWSEDMPVVFNIKTKLGVNYDAGHWFHMAENIMTQHSILRKQHKLSNNSIVYYNFDTEGFIDDLNGVTRLMVYLGTIAANNRNIKQLVYFSSSTAWKHSLSPGSTILLDRKVLEKAQVLNISPEQPPSTRFVKPTEAPKEDGKVCVKYLETIGGMWPTPQRGSWFPTTEDIDSFRHKLKDACPPNNEMLQRHKKQKQYKLVIYQRDLSRKLANEDEAITMLKAKLPEPLWDIQVLMHSSKRSPCELAHILHNADVFLTPHGFQSMLLLFLPRPSLLIEVYPYRYYKRGYGPLSHEYGLIHTGVMSPATLWHTKLLLHGVQTATCMQWKECRGYSRNQDVLLTQHGVNRAIEQINLHIVNSKFVSTQVSNVNVVKTTGSEIRHNASFPSIYEEHVVYKRLSSTRDFLY